MEQQKSRHNIWWVIAPIALAIIGLLFGDNLLERYTGYSLVESLRQKPAMEPRPYPVLATVIPSTPTASIVWRHNPSLPTSQGYPGAVSYTSRAFPGNSDRDWVYGVEVSVNSRQILLIAGYAGNLPETGSMGGPTHCFLLITRGPFTSKIDLLAAGVEVHEVAPNADTLTWAAEKVNDLKLANPTSCANDVDVWVGR